MDRYPILLFVESNINLLELNIQTVKHLRKPDLIPLGSLGALHGNTCSGNLGINTKELYQYSSWVFYRMLFDVHQHMTNIHCRVELR